MDEQGDVVEERKIQNDSITQFLVEYHPTIAAMEASTAIHPIYGEMAAHRNCDIKRFSSTDWNVKLLMTIPGIGYYFPAVIKSEAETIDRFLIGENL